MPKIIILGHEMLHVHAMQCRLLASLGIKKHCYPSINPLSIPSLVAFAGLETAEAYPLALDKRQITHV